MPFAMSQTNVTYYMFDLLNKTLSGANAVNSHTPFFKWPDGSAIDVTDGSNLGINVGDKYYVNDVLNGLTRTQRLFVYSLLNEWLHSYAYSNMLLTPLCQMMSLAFPVSILASRKRDYASFLAPWAMLGGAITVYGGIVAEEAIHVTPALIFFDQGWFFGYHMFIMTAGLSWFVYCNRYSLKRFGAAFLAIIVYVAYVNVTCPAFDIQYFTTGMTEHDYAVSGSYGIVSDILTDTDLTFPGDAALMIWAFAMFVVVFIGIKNVVHSQWWKKRGVRNETIMADAKVAWRGASAWAKSLRRRMGSRRIRR